MRSGNCKEKKIVNETEVLETAAQLIEEHGKCEEFYELKEHHLCSIGAIRKALYGHTDLLGDELTQEPKHGIYSRVMEQLSAVMMEQFGGCWHAENWAFNDPFHNITCINDKLASKDEVVACMQKAAIEARCRS